MRIITTLLVLGALVAPAQAATPEELAGAGYLGGQVLCSLTRHGAPASVLREEMTRLGAAVRKDLGVQMTQADVATLQRHFAAVLKTCPPRTLPDA